MESLKKNTNTLDSFEKLKKILLTEDQQKITEIEKKLDNLRGQLKDKEYFIETLDPIFATMLENKIIESKDEMAEALAPVMGEAIKKQVEESKEDIIDALYPVIGSTIRKSIAEAMKNLVKTVNEKLDKTFSFVMLHRKIKSKVSGVSEAEILLKESMPFQIHEVFYIHKETGILLSHVTSKIDQQTVDQDLISGMLTAIHNFAGKIFGETENQDIHKIQYDNYQIQIEMGRYAYLAVVISGVKTAVFEDKLNQLEQKLHQIFYKLLREFDGDVAEYKRANVNISKFLKTFTSVLKDSSEIGTEKRAGWLFLSFLILIFIILYGIFFYLPQRSMESTIESEIEKIKHEIPGLISGKVQYEIDGSEVQLSGETENWIKKRNIEKIILNRTSAQKVSNTIQVQNENESSTLIEKIKSSTAEIDKSLQNTLLNLNYIFQNDRLFIEGKVNSLEEKVQIGNIIANFSEVPIIINNCIVDEQTFNDAQYLINRIEEIAIHFEAGKSNPNKDELKKIAKLYNWLNEIPFFTLYIYGHSDQLGGDSINNRISQNRADNIRNHLIDLGLEPEKLITGQMGFSMPVASNETKEGRALNRRVTFSFHPYR